ncbi:hypothetical protein [Streptomyces sp. NPDC047829]
MDDLLARARRGPSPTSTSVKPVAAFVPQPLEIAETPANPYAGITRAEPGSVTPAPSLNVDAKDLFPGRRAALPAAVPEPAAPPTSPGRPRPPRRRPAPAGAHSLGGSAGDIFRELAADPSERPAPRPHQDPPPPSQDPQET